MDSITEKGVYAGKNGIIYAATIENDTMLAIVSIENGFFNIDVFGSENEPADSLSIQFNNKHVCQLSITDSEEDFCISVRNDNITNRYRLVNDSFTLSDVNPKNITLIAEYKTDKLKLHQSPSEVYSVINNTILERIKRIPYEEASVSSEEKAQLTRLLTACADIYEYNAEATDINTLMRKVLYTHKNFEQLTDIPPQTSEKSQSLKLCSEKYITSVIYNVFRKEAARPAVNMLAELGYCYNNQFYYYTGGYKSYFRTEIREILKITKLDSDSFYIVFSDTYTENDASVFEYSSATVKKDNNGFYITSLKMGDDFRDIEASDNHNTQNPENSPSKAASAVTFIIMLFILVLIGIVIYFMFL